MQNSAIKIISLTGWNVNLNLKSNGRLNKTENLMLSIKSPFDNCCSSFTLFFSKGKTILTTQLCFLYLPRNIHQVKKEISNLVQFETLFLSHFPKNIWLICILSAFTKTLNFTLLWKIALKIYIIFFFLINYAFSKFSTRVSLPSHAWDFLCIN